MLLNPAYADSRQPRSVTRPLYLLDQRHHVIRQTCVETLGVRDAFFVRICASSIKELRHIVEGGFTGRPL
jgi:hypothetical protein